MTKTKFTGEKKQNAGDTREKSSANDRKTYSHRQTLELPTQIFGKAMDYVESSSDLSKPINPEYGILVKKKHCSPPCFKIILE